MLKRFYRYFVVLLVAGLFLLGAVGNSFAQQTAQGDVIGPVGSGTGIGTTTSGTRVSRTTGVINLPTSGSRVLDAGLLSSLLDSGLIIGGLSGCASPAAAIADINDLFADIPPALQSAFMDALFSSGSGSCVLSDLIGLFDDLNSWLDGLNNILCAGLGEVSAGLAAAQNSIMSQLSPDSLGLSSLFDAGSLGLTGADVSGLGIDVDIDLTVDLGANLNIDSLISGLDFQNLVPGLSMGSCDSLNGPSNLTELTGTTPDSELDCTTSWEGPRNNLRDGNNPPTMNDPDLRYHIKRAAIEIGMPPSYLAGIIWAESAGRTTAYNMDSSQPPCGPLFPATQSSASGLIQFTRSTANEVNLYSPPSTSCNDHVSKTTSLSIEQQMDGVIKYFIKRGWEPGMTPYQAYATVHHGNPHGGSNDSTGVTTQGYFTSTVKARMEAFECGGFDWNTLEWIPGA